MCLCEHVKVCIYFHELMHKHGYVSISMYISKCVSFVVSVCIIICDNI